MTRWLTDADAGQLTESRVEQPSPTGALQQQQQQKQKQLLQQVLGKQQSL
jgi:hypothetical protein